MVPDAEFKMDSLNGPQLGINFFLGKYTQAVYNLFSDQMLEYDSRKHYL